MKHMKTPLITVILTVFRRTEYLREAIQSVVDQTCANWECIITDDANTAESKAICSEFGADERIRYRSNESVLGAPINVKVALQEARGEYVVVFNDDDCLYPQMFELLLAPLEQYSDLVVAFGNHDVMDSDGRLLPEESKTLMRCRGRHLLTEGRIFDSFDFAVRAGLVVVMGCMFRRSAVNPECLVNEVRGSYDYWLSIKLAETGRFYYVPTTVMAWRSHSNSVTSAVVTSRDIFVGEVYIFRALLANHLGPSLAGYVNSALANCLLVRGQVFLNNNWGVGAARGLIAQSFLTQWSRRTLAIWLSTFLPSRWRKSGAALWKAVGFGPKGSCIPRD